MGVRSATWSKRVVTQVFNEHHNAKWLEPQWATSKVCERDEYPPAYLCKSLDAIVISKQQRVRYLPKAENGGAGQMWNKFCWTEGLKDTAAVLEANPTHSSSITNRPQTTVITYITADVSIRPLFSIGSFELPGFGPNDHGLEANPCIPKGLVDDMYFPLLHDDLEISSVPGGPQPRGTWSYEYAQPPPQSVLQQASSIP